MNKEIDLEKIIWLDTNAMWLYQVIQDYKVNSKDLGMNYLSLGSLRYDDRYFVGFKYGDEGELPIELVAYIQYKITLQKFKLNYIETAKPYRNRGISNLMIDEFISQSNLDKDILFESTNPSYYGKKADIASKFCDKIYNNDNDSDDNRRRTR